MGIPGISIVCVLLMTVGIRGENTIEEKLDNGMRDAKIGISNESDLQFIKRAPVPMWGWRQGESSHGGGSGGHQQGESHQAPPMSDSSGEEPPTPPSPPSDQEQYLWYDRQEPSSTTTSPPLRLPYPLALTPEEFQHHQARRREELTRHHEEEKVRREHRKNLDRYQKRKMRRAERKARQEEAEERARFPSEEYYNTFFDTMRETDIEGDARRFLEQYERNKQPRIGHQLPGWVGELQRRYQRHVDNLGLLEHRREQEWKLYGGVASDEVDVLMMQEARGAVQQFRYLQNNFQSKYEMAKSIARGEYVVDDE